MKFVGGFLKQEVELEICASIAYASRFPNNHDYHINSKHIHLQLLDKKLERVTYQKTAYQYEWKESYSLSRSIALRSIKLQDAEV